MCGYIKIYYIYSWIVKQTNIRSVSVMLLDVSDPTLRDYSFNATVMFIQRPVWKSRCLFWYSDVAV